MTPQWMTEVQHADCDRVDVISSDSDMADFYTNDLQYLGNGFPCMAESQVAFNKENVFQF